MESADVGNAAVASVVPADHCSLLTSTVTAEAVSQDFGFSVPASDVTLQRPAVDVVAPASVTQSGVLVITADQLQQFSLDAGILPLVTTAGNYSQLNSSVPLHGDLQMLRSGCLLYTSPSPRDS